jgi:hypothetical protein
VVQDWGVILFPVVRSVSGLALSISVVFEKRDYEERGIVTNDQSASDMFSKLEPITQPGTKIGTDSERVGLVRSEKRHR